VLVLDESFTLLQLAGIVVVCLAAGITIATQREHARSELEATAETIP
jgi:inner membrane transporter RhtA